MVKRHADSHLGLTLVVGCRGRQAVRPPHPTHAVIVSFGPLNVPYSILGAVTGTYGDYDNDAVAFYQDQTGREPSTETEQLHAVLMYNAYRWYGSQVDAVINAEIVLEGGRNQSASGVAMHFTSPPAESH